MNSVQIECFLASAQFLSFTDAAKQLVYSPQTVSKQVSSLEGELGTALFVRKNNQIKLTWAGEYYASQMTKMRERYEDTKRKAAGISAGNLNLLRVGLSNQINPMGELSRAIHSFCHENPDIRVSVEQGDILQLLDTNQVDVIIAITSNGIRNSRYQTTMIVKEEERLIVPPSVPEAKRASAFDPYCWGAVYVQSCSPFSSHLEYQQATRRRLEQLGLMPRRIVLLPDPKSVHLAMETLPCVTVAGYRFGNWKTKANDMQSFGLPRGMSECWLQCACIYENENPVVPLFIKGLQDYFR